MVVPAESLPPLYVTWFFILLAASILFYYYRKVLATLSFFVPISVPSSDRLSFSSG
jgi:hypothetical protein